MFILFLKELTISLHSAVWLRSMLIGGMYLTSAWGIAIMLPLMAIFFPLFTLVGDFGYLVRMANYSTVIQITKLVIFLYYLDPIDKLEDLQSLFPAPISVLAKDVPDT